MQATEIILGNLQRAADLIHSRGSGGLGVHIVFNLVTQQLKGEGTLRSTPGIGCQVDLSFPCSS